MSDHLRHLRKTAHLNGTFGSDRFGRWAEKFARAFGTATFIIVQTSVVTVWIGLNIFGAIHGWDPYPFILLNLMFSTQAAYAAPLILLAQTRQAERDKAHAESTARHNQEEADLLKSLIQENTNLTNQVLDLTKEIRRP